jgi:hypothetical protein
MKAKTIVRAQKHLRGSTETKKANLIHEGITKLGVCNCCEFGKLTLEGCMLGLGSSPHHLWTPEPVLSISGVSS